MAVYRYDVELSDGTRLDLVTKDLDHARSVAIREKGYLIQETYTFDDSELLEDYTGEEEADPEEEEEE